MEIDLKELAKAAQYRRDHHGDEAYDYAQAMAVIVLADAAGRQADAAELNTQYMSSIFGTLDKIESHLSRIATAGEVLIDMMGDALTDTPVPLDDGELLPFADPSYDVRPLDIRTAKQVRQ